MRATTMRLTLLMLVPVSSGLLGQEKPNNQTEFPVVLQQNVTAGKTAAGTKIQARLLIATLVNGTVIPKNAVLSGEVVASEGKKEKDVSRLCLRMDSAQWKNGSTPLRVYLTSWYYPTVTENGQNLQYGPQQPANRTWDGQGQYPDPNSKVYRPFPGSDSGKESPVPDTPNSVASSHREIMKDIAAEQGADGGVVLVSKRGNIKVNKYTTYLFAASDPGVPNNAK